MIVSKIGNVCVIDCVIVLDEFVWLKLVLVMVIVVLVGFVFGICGVIGCVVLFGCIIDLVEIECDMGLNVMVMILYSVV